MRVRVRLWWEFLPFAAKATLIVLIAGMTVTATARAATPLIAGGGPGTSAPTAAHRATVPSSTDLAPSSAVAVPMVSFVKRPRLRTAHALRVTRAHHLRRIAQHRTRHAARPHQITEAVQLDRATHSPTDFAMGSVHSASPVTLPASAQPPSKP